MDFDAAQFSKLKDSLASAGFDVQKKIASEVLPYVRDQGPEATMLAVREALLNGGKLSLEEAALQGSIALTAQVERSVAEGKGVAEISNQLNGKGVSAAVATNYAQKGVQQDLEGKYQQQMADHHAEYLLNTGQAVLEQTAEHPLAAVLAQNDGIAQSFAKAMNDFTPTAGVQVATSQGISKGGRGGIC
jgi:thiamine phosphate synthase YjbQ (UPF0047 family)